ncbi:MAG: DegV family protein [Streptococcaceae bacterium]|nr:DegV family protein [Streptococcaceae bacterium]
MKLAIITDTSADISANYHDFEDLFVLEIPISIDGKSLKTSQMTHEQYFEYMAKAKKMPATSQPNVAELEELLRNIASQGYTHVLGLFLTSGISGFYQNAFYLQNELENMKIVFPETYITSSPLGYMVETVIEGSKSGKTFEEILKKFEAQCDADNAFMLVDDLKWLAKGGRLSNGSAAIGTLLNIKPLLQFSDDGKVIVYDKVRTVKKALSAMKNLLLDSSKPETHKVFVLHTGAMERAQELYDYAKEQGYQDVELTTLGPVIATHLGIGAVAYAVALK